jgi:hypothetical protein
MNRLAFLFQMRWATGAALPADVRACLSQSEAQASTAYNEALSAYMRSIRLDLTVVSGAESRFYVCCR